MFENFQNFNEAILITMTTQEFTGENRNLGHS